MTNFVKIKIEDDNGKFLKHYYLRIKQYDFPAGMIESGESPKQAAIRELLERTGFVIKEENLNLIEQDDDFLIFSGKKKDLLKQANPGQLGGYETYIKWE